MNTLTAADTIQRFFVFLAFTIAVKVYHVNKHRNGHN